MASEVERAGNLDLHRPQKPGNIHGSRFAFRVGVGGHNDLPDLSGAYTVQQFLDLDVILGHMIQRGNDTVEHMVSTPEFPGTFHSDHIPGFRNHTDNALIAHVIITDGTQLPVSQILTVGAGMYLLF